jgi:peptidoglycan/xylan/chitin deacetylase (PgdA/CDA1 family)
VAPGANQIFRISEAQPRARPRSMLIPAIAAAVLALALLLIWRLISATIAAGPGAAEPAVRAAVTPQPAQGFDLPRLLFGEPTITPLPTVVPTPTPLPAPAGYVAYTIAPSDTLELIAERHGSIPAAIAAENLLGDDPALRPERQIVVPVYDAGVAGGIPQIVARGNPATPRVALTFDIELDEASLYSILEAMRQRNVKGTFFLTGRWVQSYPDAARAIVADGHEIGNHSLSHPFFSRIGLDGATNEIVETERIIREVTGVSSKPYFRFPYGDSTGDTVTLLARAGYIAYHWSADDPAIDNWIAGVTANPAAGHGGILLMHGRHDTAAKLGGWIDQLIAAGLEPTTLGETLR